MQVVADRGHLPVAGDLLHLRIEDEVDLLIGTRPVLEDRLGAELAPAVDDVDPARVAGQEVALFERGVTAADDGEDLVLEEGAVADRAIGDPAAGQLGLARHLQLSGEAAGGHDHGRSSQLGA